ncbi:MAG: energy transducer TonB [Proteobacteria bacterium]|nr:energy transducer TonB [Pseudomonadota bacterium]
MLELLLALVAGPETTEAAEKGHVVVPLAWAAMPDYHTFMRYYPAGAALYAMPARVVIECEVTAQGVTADCKVVSEDPPGVGFGEASLSAARHFRFKPKTIDGRPVSDPHVTIPVNFASVKSTPEDVKWAERCAGWGQSTYEAMVPPAPAVAEWGYAYWRFKFTQHALQTGQKPSQIMQELERMSAVVGPRRLRAADQYRDCYGEARQLELAPLKLRPAVTQADLKTAEDCAGKAAALVESAEAPSPAMRQRYATWASLFVTDAIALGLKPKEIDRRLEAARTAAAGASETSDAVQACDAAAKGRNPLALPEHGAMRAG